MYTNLMHSTGEGLTQNDTGFAIVSQFLKSRYTIFALWRHFANTNFVANNFYWLLTLNNSSVNKIE